ncbi:MAG: HAMP domain-containing histidine kinase [Sporolactobacillus sp.]|jgi:signal transduction histidine kinase|nr:HAMP domain-containing histidine kinase [Sporolactobacillus sp.]MCI1882415.1 HAMP domain-containing histidine kinase [Sporolactobacillus sp.]
MTLFRKTLIRLTLINALLLILMLALLGGTIYFYERSVTYRGSDQLLRQAAGQITRPGPFIGGDRPSEGIFERRGRVLNWVILDKKNRPIRSSLDDQLTEKERQAYFKLFRTDTTGVIIERKISGSYFHILARKVTLNGTPMKLNFSVDVTTEKNLLNTLLSIILYGLAIGAALSIIGGYVLARRAIQPIRRAWDKQNRFVADASHELRTPLSILQLKTESLLRHPHRQIQETGEDIAVMLDETRRLSRLVANLLTLARSDANRLEISPEPLDLAAVTKKVTEPFVEMAELDEKSFSVTTPADALMIDGDPQRIHQLLVILLDNAMKFTPKHGRIVVSCTREGRSAILTVSDSGVGIAEKDLPHVFDRFFQADTSRSDQRGTGLGLSIAQWIVEKHRGRIDVHSKQGMGTTFTVRLPLIRKEDSTRKLISGRNRSESHEKGMKKQR